MQILEFRNRVFKPQSAYLSPGEEVIVSKERAMAFLIGALAIFLAFGVAWLDELWAPACARTSISHYFYEPVAGTFFVLVLSFVGAFMIAFRGQTRLEGWLATIGGVGGLMLAFFPTENIGCYSEDTFDLRPAVMIEFPLTYAAVEDKVVVPPTDPIPDAFDIASKPGVSASEAKIGTGTSQRLHMIGAVAMFAVLLIFCLIFTRVDDDTDWIVVDGQKRLKWQKLARNVVYVGSALTMAVGIAMILGSDGSELLTPGTGPDFDGLTNNALGAVAGWTSGFVGTVLGALPWSNPDYVGVIRPVYHGEMLALVAFGCSWLLKGRFGKSVLDYIRGSVGPKSSGTGRG